MPTVLVPTAYRGPTLGKAEIEVEAATVRACIEAVEAEYPGFLTLVLDDDGGVHRFVKLFINGDPIENLAVDTAVDSDDRVEVLAAIAGG